MVRNVAIIGTGMTKFGEHWEKSLRDLIAEAGTEAVNNAGISGTDIQAIYGGTMSAGRLNGQEHIGALIADTLGLNPLPSTRVEAACASGGLALREAYMMIAGGHYDVIVAGGAEKMTDVYSEQASLALGGAADQEWEAFFGATFPALYALLARRHMYEYGTTEEQMARVSVVNHHNAALNPLAQYPYPVTVDDVMKSQPIAEPLKLLDCSPLTDGAAAVVLASEGFAKKVCENPVWIKSSAQASDTLPLHDRRLVTTLDASVLAGKAALAQAGLQHKDIKVLEVHDCFSIAGIVAVEDLGFTRKGEGGKAFEEGRFDLGSDVSLNTSGGLKACGHPVGATGIKQAIEITLQLQGKAGKRQVDADYGMSHNVGGSGATVVVHTYGRDL